MLKVLLLPPPPNEQEFGRLLETRACFIPQALSLEVYATVRLGRALLLGRSRSTERACPCVCFRVNQRQD